MIKMELNLAEMHELCSTSFAASMQLIKTSRDSNMLIDKILQQNRNY